MGNDTLNRKPLYPAIDRRSREPKYFDGMKHFTHPRLGARPNRRLPGVDKWQEEKSASSEIRLPSEHDLKDKLADVLMECNGDNMLSLAGAALRFLRPYMAQPVREISCTKCDAEMLRVKACEHIAEGEEGWQKLRNECPSTMAVAKLRDVYEEAHDLLEILQGAMLGLQSMSNESAKPRFDEYIELGRDFLLRNSIEDGSANG